MSTQNNLALNKLDIKNNTKNFRTTLIKHIFPKSHLNIFFTHEATYLDVENLYEITSPALSTTKGDILIASSFCGFKKQLDCWAMLSIDGELQNSIAARFSNEIDYLVSNYRSACIFANSRFAQQVKPFLSATKEGLNLTLILLSPVIKLDELSEYTNRKITLPFHIDFGFPIRAENIIASANQFDKRVPLKPLQELAQQYPEKIKLFINSNSTDHTNFLPNKMKHLIQEKCFLYY